RCRPSSSSPLFRRSWHVIIHGTPSTRRLSMKSVESLAIRVRHTLGEVHMTTNATALRNDVTAVAHQPQAAYGLAIVRLTVGAMLVWVFFENLGKGLYYPTGYVELINHYIRASHSPAAWKWVMGQMASHAALAAPMQAATEISLGTLLIIGLL